MGRALALAGEQDPGLRARALSALADLIWEQQRDFPTATAAATEALALFRALGDVEGTVHALTVLGGLAADQGDLDRGQVLLEEAVALSADEGYTRAFAVEVLSVITYLQGNDARTVALLDEQVRVAARAGRSRTHGLCHRDLVLGGAAPGRPRARRGAPPARASPSTGAGVRCRGWLTAWSALRHWPL